MLRNALLALMLAAPAADAASVKVNAYDDKGRVMDRTELLKYIGPLSASHEGITPEKSGLRVSDLRDRPVEGRPWWGRTKETVWTWDGADQVRFSLPWPIAKDGFSTLVLDGGGQGYLDGQTILLNEELAASAYTRLQQSLKDRSEDWDPPYAPSENAKNLIKRAKDQLVEAKEEKTLRTRAKLFNEALSSVSYAWQQIIYEHGLQTIHDKKRGPQMRWGLTLDESAVERINDFSWIADKTAAAGANWVRLVFQLNPKDFTYSRPHSFALYDKLISELGKKKIRVMGSVLDSMLWPHNLTPELYKERTKNLVYHFKDAIRSWEVGSEPNGDWLGGTREPLPDETILLCVQQAVIEVKRIDPALETIATLHWWDGTAPDDRHGLFDWLRWSLPRGFGKGLDVVGLSIYPHRHPMGIAFDPVFRDLAELLPDQRLMLGGWSFGEERKLKGYWWLKPKNVGEARKDLLVLYTGAAAAIPHSVGGGFFWPTLEQMLPPKRGNEALYRIYKDTVKRLRSD